jgi:hypothetical protein
MSILKCFQPLTIHHTPAEGQSPTAATGPQAVWRKLQTAGKLDENRDVSDGGVGSFVMRGWLLLVLAAGVALPAGNVLTPEEKKAGWILLFDGSTLRNWRNPATEDQPRDAWVIEDGALKSRVHPRIEEDLVTEATFRDFELVFDWRVAPGGNTGIKYRAQHLIFLDLTKARSGPGGYAASMDRALHDRRMRRSKLAPGARGHVYTVAVEMQLIDDDRNPDGKKGPKFRTGALYGMIAAEPAPAHPAGEWNSGRLVVKGGHIEHWVNGVKVLDGSLSSPGVREGALARWKQAPGILKMLTHPKPRGPIALQHHGEEVWFRNLKLRRL